MRWLAVVAVLVGCDASPRRDLLFVDAQPHHDAVVAPAVCYAPSETGMVMPGASSVESCAIWNSLAQMSGVVTVARSPQDLTQLTMTFGSGPVIYTGTVVNDQVSLTYFHLHDFEDGCKWRATETLTGTLDDSTCVLSLSYKYRESVEVSNGACATPCSGDGTFSLDIVPIIE
jgi:hypothetical protein